MSLVIADRVKETTTTTGTGALTLAGAMTGFRAFSSVCSTNDTCYYAIAAVDGNGAPTGDWEVGLGTYSGTNTLTRTTVSASSNSGSAVNLSAGTKQVWFDLTAADYIATREAALTAKPKLTILNRAANQSISLSTWTAVSYDTEVLDEVNAFSSGTPTQVVVPSGYTKVRVTSYTVWANSGTTTSRLQALEKNGTTTVQLAAITKNLESGQTLITPWLTVTPGDYFRVMVYTGSSIDLSGTGFAGPTSLQFEWLP